MDDLAREGGELPLRASGPMPPGAAQHMAGIVQTANEWQKRPKLKLADCQEAEDILDEDVREGVEKAMKDVVAKDAIYAEREAELQVAPPLPDAEKALREAERTENLCKTVKAAEKAGVWLELRVPVEKPVG